MLNAKQAIDLTVDLVAEHERDRDRMKRLDRYWNSQFDLPWMPIRAHDEYRMLVERAKTNWLKLVVKVVAQRLVVDGIRSSVSEDVSSAAWASWQANRLDARQRQLYRSTLLYGLGYVTVWPDDDIVAIAPESPRVMYGRMDCEEPTEVEVAIKRWQEPDRSWRAALYDEEACYRLSKTPSATWVLDETIPHGIGECPVVRFTNNPDLEGGFESEIWPLIPIQDRIHETILDRLMSQKYAAFRQRWATGMAIPQDDEGRPIEPFKAAVDRLWIGEDAETKFGEFSATDLAPFIAAVGDDVRQLAAVAQVSPNHLLGDLINLSADALVAAQDGERANVADHQGDLGESWEDVMRLAGAAAGMADLANDQHLEVVWRDTEARSPAVLADSLTKLKAIGVPLQFLLERLGLSDTAVARVMELKRIEDQAGARTQAAALGMDAALMASPTPVNLDGLGA